MANKEFVKVDKSNPNFAVNDGNLSSIKHKHRSPIYMRGLLAATIAAAGGAAGTAQAFADEQTPVLREKDDAQGANTRTTTSTAQGDITATSETAVEVDYDGTILGIYKTTITNNSALNARVTSVAVPYAFEWTCNAIGAEIAPGETTEIEWTAKTELPADAIDYLRQNDRAPLGTIEYSLSFTELPGTYTIAGDNVTGATLQAQTDGAPADATLEFNWYAIESESLQSNNPDKGGEGGEGESQDTSDKAAYNLPAGATHVGVGNTFTITDDLAGKQIALVVRDTDGRYLGTQTSNATARTRLAHHSGMTAEVTGSAFVGEPLQATVQNAPELGTSTFTYRWLKNGEAIAGATDDTYTPTTDDINAQITVEVSATNDMVDAIDTATSAKARVTNKQLYLSDVEYMSHSNSGWGDILMDESYDSDIISLIVDGERTYFPRGVAAHATSNLFYDVREIAKEYDYFVCYAGVDASKGSNGNGVKIWPLTSSSTAEDGNHWQLAQATEPVVVKGDSEATLIKIPLKGVSYIKLHAHNNGSSDSDHVVYADAKFVTANYVDAGTQNINVPDVGAITDEIKAALEGTTNGGGGEGDDTASFDPTALSDDLQFALMKRQLIMEFGEKSFANLYAANDYFASAVDWLFADISNIQMYLNGGTPDGTYNKSLIVLGRLLESHGDDIADTSMCAYGGTTRGNLYKRMIVSLALTHSANCGFWAGGQQSDGLGPNGSDPITRYEIFKRMYLADKLDTDVFETREVEEMRFVMNAIIDDESIEWLRDYTFNYNHSNVRDPYTYIDYGGDLDYTKAEYYDPANYEMWDAKYNLSDYGITYQSGYPKEWIVFEVNGVCGAISKTGTIIQNVYGVPASVVGQPAHAAYIYQKVLDDGRVQWQLGNDVGGWAQSGRTEKLAIRMIAGWGETDHATYTDDVKPDSYIFLAQEAIDDFDAYERAEAILRQVTLYNGEGGEGTRDVAKLEAIYEAAIAAQACNFDAWLGLARLYAAEASSFDEDKCVKLFNRIAEQFKYHPLPMYDLQRILADRITTAEKSIATILTQQAAWTAASKATQAESIHSGGVRQVANALLGNVSSDVAYFDFNGAGGATISLADRYRDTGVVWEYSLDAGTNWTQAQSPDVVLTDAELAQVNVDNDVWVHIVGTPLDTDNIYVIDVTQAEVAWGVQADDENNVVLNATETMQWREVKADGTYGEWTSFKGDLEHKFEGNITIEVMIVQNGAQFASGTKTINFTRLNEVDECRLIEQSTITLRAVSSAQEGEGGENVLDGNSGTIWHSLWDGSDTERWISFDLGSEKWVSALNYLPRQSSSNGRAKAVTVYTSLDGTNWTSAKSETGWADDSLAKAVDFGESVQARYVALKFDEYYGHKSFASAAEINIYEDKTKTQQTTRKADE